MHTYIKIYCAETYSLIAMSGAGIRWIRKKNSWFHDVAVLLLILLIFRTYGFYHAQTTKFLAH